MLMLFSVRGSLTLTVTYPDTSDLQALTIIGLLMEDSLLALSVNDVLKSCEDCQAQG